MSETTNMTEAEVLPDYFTTIGDGGRIYPFVEDDNANITGRGHQDKAEFAQRVNEWDDECGCDVHEDDRFDADSIGHDYARLDADGERLWRCSSTEDGAFPITTLWGQR